MAKSLSMSDFLQTVKERVVVYDGAMGTNIQSRNPTLDDYWGKENCSEVLVLSRPDIIRDIHADFFRVGCDIVETNTFGGGKSWGLQAKMRRRSVICFTRSIGDRGIRLGIRLARIWKTRRSCLCC
jgi:methionine synthase I (cobalamin-dependent)